MTLCMKPEAPVKKLCCCRKYRTAHFRISRTSFSKYVASPFLMLWATSLAFLMNAVRELLVVSSRVNASTGLFNKASSRFPLNNWWASLVIHRSIPCLCWLAPLLEVDGTASSLVSVDALTALYVRGPGVVTLVSLAPCDCLVRPASVVDTLLQYEQLLQCRRRQLLRHRRRFRLGAQLLLALYLCFPARACWRGTWLCP